MITKLLCFLGLHAGEWKAAHSHHERGVVRRACPRCKTLQFKASGRQR
jgi:hypothetical protein